MILTRLVRGGVRVSSRTVVTAAHGTGRLARVRLARVDRRWNVTGGARDVAASPLVLGYGFSASTELARQAGCEVVHDARRGGWVVTQDTQQRTSVPGVSVAGEPAGVAGADQARAEGSLAGLAAAADLGRAVLCAAFAAALASARGLPVGRGGCFSARLPIRPVPLGDLCGLDPAGAERPAAGTETHRSGAGATPAG